MYSRILVPIDGSPTSDAGLEEAIRLARLSGGCIRLAHLVDELPYLPESATFAATVPDMNRPAVERGERLLRRKRARVADEGLTVDVVQEEGIGKPLAEFVCEQVEAWRADVIVLGTHGRRGVSRLVLGSGAEQIVRRASVPVLLVRFTQRLDPARSERIVSIIG